MHPTPAALTYLTTDELKTYQRQCNAEQDTDDLSWTKEDALMARKALVDAIILDRKLNGAL